MGAYSASKVGVEAMANCLRTEVKHIGVDVGVAYFSWIGTDMVHGADENPVGQRMRADAARPGRQDVPARGRRQGGHRGHRAAQADRRHAEGGCGRCSPTKTLVQRLTERRATPELMAEVDQITRDEVETHGKRRSRRAARAARRSSRPTASAPGSAS